MARRGMNRRISLDALCTALLIVLWALFFWRLFTPNPANQLSLKEGDFSGQFVAWAAYQAERLSQGQIPLWNPYNNSGHPFLADTQAAALYPPRLITLAALNAVSGGQPSPGAIYAALQIEMTLHVLFASLLMYAFVRRLMGSPAFLDASAPAVPAAAPAAALVAALTFAYGGYLTGYPPLQLAVLETGAWLPLALIGIHAATQPQSSTPTFLAGIGTAGVALGLAFHAGHSQTGLQFIYLGAAFLAYRVWQARQAWRLFVFGVILFGAMGGGLGAVQVIPGLEFTRLTARNANFTFDSQGNGFPLYDVAQMLIPGVLSLWSPLYFGIAGFALAVLAVWRKVSGALFWIGAAALALGLSFGHNTLFWDIFYNVVPGFSLFRGQERAAFTVAVCSAILTGLGAYSFLSDFRLPARYGAAVRVTLGGIGLIVAIFLIHWQFTPADDTHRLSLLTFSLIMGALTTALLSWPISIAVTAHDAARPDVTWRAVGLVALVVFDLFTFARNTTSADYDAAPARDRLKAPPLVQTVQADHDGVFRVDGRRGLLENYGSLYAVSDINGISPLRLDRYEKLLGLPAPRAWELLAVRYVFTDNNDLSIPSTIVAQGADPIGKINLHRLSDPRPFARLVYRTWIAADDASALNALADPAIDVRHTVILPADPGLALPADPPGDGRADVLDYAPEAFSVRTHSAAPAVLDLSQVWMPGWQATLDDQSAPLLRSNLALMAVALPPGDHVVKVRYQPLSVTLGAAISAGTSIVVIAGMMVLVIVNRRNRHATASTAATR